MTHDQENDASPLHRQTMVDCIRADPADLVSWALRVQTIADLAVGPGVRVDPSSLDIDDEHQDPSAALVWKHEHPLRIMRTVHLPTESRPGEPFAIWRMERHPSFSNYGQYVVDIPIERIDGDPEAMCDAGDDPAHELRTLARILRDEAARRMACTDRRNPADHSASETMTELAVRAREIAAPVLAPFRSMELQIGARSSTPWSKGWIQVYDRAQSAGGRNRGHYEIELPDDPSIPHCISVTEIRETFTYTLRVGASNSGCQNLPTSIDPVTTLRRIADSGDVGMPRVMRRLHRHDPSEDLGAGSTRP